MGSLAFLSNLVWILGPHWIYTHQMFYSFYKFLFWGEPLTLIWVGFLGVRFDVEEGGGVKTTPTPSKTC